ncbi:hypothetical protein [Micromonospora sp. NPDC050200]|uniref:hypothetical protein n=1 Tax=Micromonospora sp. NPDC050200 TaxID=3155664 RepID=UPI00340FA7E2
MSSGEHRSPIGSLERAGGVFEDDALIDQVNRALRSMWSRLESLSRSDEFWSGTNHHATRYKVEDFAGRCVSRNPSDETARWALVGLSMQAGSFSGLHLLAEEAPTRDGAVFDLIAVAEWVWLEVGLDPGADLERALLRADPAVLKRLAEPPGGRVGRAAAAALAFLGGWSFAEAIGRRRWEMFVHALVVSGRSSSDLAVVSEALIVAGEHTLAAAREWLANDASAVVDLVDAAHWWSVYRDADVTDRLRELLEAVSRRDLEQLVGDREDRAASSLRTALLILDGHGLTSRPDT